MGATSIWNVSDTGFPVNGTPQDKLRYAVKYATLAPPARTDSAGLKESTIPVGATVTIRGKRNTDPKKFEIKTERVTYAGKNFDVYPDRL